MDQEGELSTIDILSNHMFMRAERTLYFDKLGLSHVFYCFNSYFIADLISDHILDTFVTGRYATAGRQHRHRDIVCLDKASHQLEVNLTHRTH